MVVKLVPCRDYLIDDCLYLFAGFSTIVQVWYLVVCIEINDWILPYLNHTNYYSLDFVPIYCTVSSRETSKYRLPILFNNIIHIHIIHISEISNFERSIKRQNKYILISLLYWTLFLIIIFQYFHRWDTIRNSRSHLVFRCFPCKWGHFFIYSSIRLWKFSS